MSEQPEDHLISTFFDFGGRSFSVVVRHDGFSYWFESSVINDYRQIMFTAKFKSNDAKLLSSIESEHTLRAPVPAVELRIIREELSPLYWAETPADDKILDAILEPIFWKHINPQLSPPIDT